MGTIVHAVVRSEQFALSDTFERLPDAEFEALRVASCAATRALPYLWGTASDDRALRHALEVDSSTESIDQLSKQGGRSLYRITWAPSIQFTVDTLVSEEGTLVSATAGNGQWNLQVLYPDHDEASVIYDDCRDIGIDLVIDRVEGGTGAIGVEGVGLSTKQGDALAAALELGYYAVPRRITLKDLAEEVGVSHQALSERLRRGHRVVISNLLGGESRPFEPVDFHVGTGTS